MFHVRAGLVQFLIKPLLIRYLWIGSYNTFKRLDAVLLTFPDRLRCIHTNKFECAMVRMDPV